MGAGLPAGIVARRGAGRCVFRRRIPVQGARPFLRLHERPVLVRWTEDTGRFLLLAGLLYPAGAVAVESGRGNRRPGEEYGSARWGDPRAIGKKYRDRRHREKNILLTQHVALGLDGRITKRNTHQLIVGGSGAGKTRYFCRPM